MFPMGCFSHEIWQHCLSSTPAAGSALSSAESSFKVTAKETPHCSIFLYACSFQTHIPGQRYKKAQKKTFYKQLKEKKTQKGSDARRRLPSYHQCSGSQSGPGGPPILQILDMTHPFQETEPLIMS